MIAVGLLALLVALSVAEFRLLVSTLVLMMATVLVVLVVVALFVAAVLVMMALVMLLAMVAVLSLLVMMMALVALMTLLTMFSMVMRVMLVATTVLMMMAVMMAAGHLQVTHSASHVSRRRHGDGHAYHGHHQEQARTYVFGHVGTLCRTNQCNRLARNLQSRAYISAVPPTACT
jgi:ABC-type multidrug transport system fused ATPase/permease subunit